MASNPFYVATGAPGSHADGLSAQMRAEFRLIEYGFVALPKISTTGQYGTTFIQQGSYTFNLPSRNGSLALLSDVATETARATAAEAANALALSQAQSSNGSLMSAETSRALAAEALLAPKSNPVFPSGLTVGTGTSGNITLTPGDGTHTGYVAFFSPSGVRQGYVGFEAASGTIALAAENGATGYQTNGSLAVGGTVSGSGYRANQGLPNGGDSSTNGYAFGADGDTGLFSPTINSNNPTNGVASIYANNVEVSRFSPGATVFNGTVTINDPSGNDLGSLIVSSPSNAAGANVKLTGNGSSAPSKTLRSYNGHLAVVNDAYTAEIMTLDDAGNLVVTGALTAQAGIPALTTETNRALAAEALLAPKINPVFPSGLIVGGGSVGGAQLFAGDSNRTGYIGFFAPSGVRQGYIGYQAANGTVALQSEGTTTGFFVGGDLTVSGTFTAPALTAETNRAIAAEATKYNASNPAGYQTAANVNGLIGNVVRNDSGANVIHLGYASGLLQAQVDTTPFGQVPTQNFPGNFVRNSDALATLGALTLTTGPILAMGSSPVSAGGYLMNSTSVGPATTAAYNIAVNAGSNGMLAFSYLAASDGRLKSERTPISNEEGERFVQACPPYRYIKGGSHECGFIAQDLGRAGFGETLAALPTIRFPMRHLATTVPLANIWPCRTRPQRHI